MNKLYFTIDSNNLGLYFSRAIIVPQKYLSEKVDDFQSYAPNHLIFTKKKYTDKSDCCLEVVLTDDEMSSLVEISDNCKLLCSAIPISRVSKILFYSKEKMERAVGLALSSSFIPNRLVKYIEKESTDTLEVDKLNFDVNECPIDLNNLIKKYNSYLGGFAFMRLGGDIYKNYSENYFTTLGYFNAAVKNDISKVESKLNFDNKYYGLFDNSKGWKKYNSVIFGSNSDVISAINEKIPYKNNRYQIEGLKNKRELYTLGVLANYGPSPNNPNTIDSLVMALVSNNLAHREASTLFFGLHVGYQSFHRLYAINDGHQIVKYQLSSKLDYYTIESIFRYIFNNKEISEDFEYLESILPTNEKIIDKNKYYSYKVLDEDVIYAIKPQSIIAIFKQYIKKNYFTEVLNSLVDDFSHRNNIELIDDQISKYKEHMFNVIQNPLHIEIQKLVDNIMEYQQYIVSEKDKRIHKLERKIEETNKKSEELSLLLQSTDKDLFDQIDINKNGVLDINEIFLFSEKLSDAKKQSLNIVDEPFEFSKSVIDDIHENEEQLTKNDARIHEYYLNKLTIAGLKKVVKEAKMQIDIENVNDKNKNNVINKILNHYEKLS